MRKFKLMNALGEERLLQGNGVFFASPEGLGFEWRWEYAAGGDYFFKAERNFEPQPIRGELVFSPPNAYQKYNEFVSWLVSSSGLTLGYSPSGEWWNVDVDVEYIEKTELSTGGSLVAPIGFATTSPFYKPNALEYEISGEEEEDGKIYEYTYPYIYSDSAAEGEITVTFSAQMESDFKLLLMGGVSAPVITFSHDDTGETIGQIDLSAASAAADETILYSGVPKDAGVWLKSPGGDTDLSTVLGISSLPSFFRLPPNVPINVKIEAGEMTNLTARLIIYAYHRTV